MGGGCYTTLTLWNFKLCLCNTAKTLELDYFKDVLSYRLDKNNV